MFQKVHYEWFNRSLIVSDCGKIQIFNGTNLVEEDIHNYLYSEETRKLYHSILATGFYSCSDGHSSDRLKFTHSTAGSTDEWHLELFRNKVGWYVYESNQKYNLRGKLIHWQDINNQDVVDFHQHHIMPAIDLQANYPGVSQADYCFRLATSGSINFTEEESFTVSP